MNNSYLKLPFALVLIVISGCASGPKERSYSENAAGRSTIYEDPGSLGSVQGIGIESQDIMSMTDQMMRDMLSNPLLAGRTSPPRIILDNAYITNESTSIVNTNMMTDRLRANLNRAANGRMIFVGRQYAAMVEQERALKREGVVDGGSIRKTSAAAGADYRLVGRLTSQDALDRRTQEKARYSQITFEMIDLELGTIVWSGFYEMRKSAQDNVIYR